MKVQTTSHSNRLASGILGATEGQTDIGKALKGSVAPPTKRILVVEDDPAHAQTLDACLKTAGFSCEIRKTGHAALLATERETFPIAVIDLQLPDVDGFDLFRLLRRHLPNLMAIMHAEDVHEGSTIETVDEHVFACVCKSGDSAELVEEVRRAYVRLEAEARRDRLYLEALSDVMADNVDGLSKRSGSSRTSESSEIPEEEIDRLHKLFAERMSAFSEIEALELRAVSDREIFKNWLTGILEEEGSERPEHCLGRAIRMVREVSERRKSRFRDT